MNYREGGSCGIYAKNLNITFDVMPENKRQKGLKGYVEEVKVSGSFGRTAAPHLNWAIEQSGKSIWSFGCSF